MAENTWWTYVSRITNGASGIQIATLTGLDAGAISRWKSGRASVSAEAAVRLARAVNRPPVEALVAAGFLDAKEVERAVYLPASFREVSDRELLEEVARRMSRPTQSDVDVVQHLAGIAVVAENMLVEFEGLANNPVVGRDLLDAHYAVIQSAVSVPNEIVPFMDTRTVERLKNVRATADQIMQAWSPVKPAKAGSDSSEVLRATEEQPEDAIAARTRDPHFAPDDPAGY
ncbi:helix-turn-helix transcriptional regulator [Gordonia malaquae]|uniref:helix-turn-helix domain-containing protein n=1 Tax=Gordonia malaquae TaxID=410332 RepID=UPI0030FF25E5